MRATKLPVALHRLWKLKRQPLTQAQSMTTTSRLVAAKEDMSTDNQEDSSANKEALESSQKVAKKAENVSLGADTEHAEETGDPVRFEPEVADRSRGSAFPHQTDADRQANLASSTQGEAPVKTREYTPTSDDKKIYPEES